MHRLSILLLLYILLVGSENAARVEPNNLSFGSSGISNFVPEITNDKNNLTTLSKIPQASQLTSQTGAFPQTLWLVVLGVCLFFLGYKMKNKTK
ncbi:MULTISPECIES: hypothetical protein [Methylobacter]